MQKLSQKYREAALTVGEHVRRGRAAARRPLPGELVAAILWPEDVPDKLGGAQAVGKAPFAVFGSMVPGGLPDADKRDALREVVRDAQARVGVYIVEAYVCEPRTAPPPKTPETLVAHPDTYEVLSLSVSTVDEGFAVFQARIDKAGAVGPFREVTLPADAVLADMLAYRPKRDGVAVLPQVADA